MTNNKRQMLILSLSQWILFLRARWVVYNDNYQKIKVINTKISGLEIGWFSLRRDIWWKQGRSYDPKVRLCK